MCVCVGIPAQVLKCAGVDATGCVQTASLVKSTWCYVPSTAWCWPMRWPKASTWAHACARRHV
eukprot:11814877-Alexandrium_andersonii.AAC.1